MFSDLHPAYVQRLIHLPGQLEGIFRIYKCFGISINLVQRLHERREKNEEY